MEWKVKKIYNAEDVERLGYSRMFEMGIYLVKLRDGYKFVFFDKEEDCTVELKDRYDLTEY